jgi:hypothetical protein
LLFSQRDAIQSVQMNRLFPMESRHPPAGGGDLPTAQRQLQLQQQQPSTSTAPPQIAIMPTPAAEQQQMQSSAAAAERPDKQHHLALDAADTSQGAVHAFQDEQGNWFTYWFGPQSEQQSRGWESEF